MKDRASTWGAPEVVTTPIVKGQRAPGRGYCSLVSVAFPAPRRKIRPKAASAGGGAT